MGKFPWTKKKWQKVACNFILQEYDASVGRGWSDIAEPTGEPPSISSAKELMKPGNHYRLIARAVEDSEKDGIKAGTYVDVVWKTYEPLVGGVREIKEKPKQAKETRPTDVTDLMSKYADEVDRVLTPLAKIGEVFGRIRESVLGAEPRRGKEGSEEEGEGGYGQIPPLEYDGKAPWFMHPYVAHTLAEEIKGVIDYGAKRFEQVMKGGAVEAEGAAEEEEPLLPSIKEFEAVKPTEEKASEEEAEEPAVKEKEKEIPPSEGEALAPPVQEEPLVPSLIEEEKPSEEKVEEPKVKPEKKRRRKVK